MLIRYRHSLFVICLAIYACVSEATSNSSEPSNQHSVNSRLPILYVYTIVPAICRYGMPEYLRISLEQALLTQPDCDVIMASNFGDCSTLSAMVEDIPNVIMIDSVKIESLRTQTFRNLSKEIFQSDRFGELWLTSALRFFIMEDIMINMKYTEMMHVEGDNLLYGRITKILPILRKGYEGLAATPLLANKSFITASVFWIANFKALKKFNDFLYSIASDRSSFKRYLVWLRPYGCCKRGGVDQDEHGNGIKPFSINEMSMLAYYHHIKPQEFKLLPVIPHQVFVLNRWVCNMSDFGPGGKSVGPETGDGIWDPNSWGQYLGGTSFHRGKDVGFRDGSHIIGQAIGTTGCKVSMECSNENNEDITYPFNKTPYYVGNKWVHKCLTAPYVNCVNGPATRLWNLHVHSKHTHKFISHPCECGSNPYL